MLKTPDPALAHLAALRDAVRMPGGAAAFAQGLNEFLHGKGSVQSRFERWIDVVRALPRRPRLQK